MPPGQASPNELRLAEASRHRRALLEELDAYAPVDARERDMRDRLRAFVAANEDCFERTNVAGHVTGSAWIVDADASAVVLLHHRKLDRWLQPGGHADGDGDVRRVALREAMEETGLPDLAPASAGIYDLDVHEIPARGDEPAHLHYDVRHAFYAHRDEAPIVSDESHAVRWVPFAEIEHFTIDESVRRLVAKSASLRTSAQE
jgi:8-oxo-dGTP pyrophosphatase MutT (NUDIX family)